MTQQEFYNTPEVLEAIEIQKRNPYGSDAHKTAHKSICNAAHKYNVWDAFVTAYGAEY